MCDNVSVVLDDGAYLPERGHDLDAGLDLRTPVEVTIPAKGSASIDTGVHVAIPGGYWGKLESKSGLNVKHSVVSLGGTIDAGYTGSIVVKLYNFGDEDYTFTAGDKVVQLVIMPCGLPRVILAESLSKTERGDNGFGSTGK